MYKILKQHKVKIALITILLLTAFLTFYAAWNTGNANAYYTAAVKSMLSSWHNFFFASFDPAGYISVDKPALGLWIQCIFGLIFGVHGWSMILAEVICALISVTLLYHLVQRSFGKPAGLIAALALALTPIFVVTARTNNLDMSLIMVLLFAVWAMMCAAERGSLKLLLVSMILLGLAFNIKTLQAYMVLPALLCTYIFTAQVPLRKRFLHLLLGIVVLAAVSFGWLLAVDLTPAKDRPYVGSSQTNSQIELMLNYNGINRMTGNRGNFNPGNNNNPPDMQDGNFRARRTQDNNSADKDNLAFNNPPESNGPPNNGNNFPGRGGMPMGGGMNEGGTPGVFRLWNEEMGSQASWLLPFSFFGILVLALGLKGQEKKAHLRALIIWGIWLLPMIVFFCIAGFFHRYYLSMLAPGISALTGIAAVKLWQYYKQDGWKKFLLPAAILTTAALQILLVSRYPVWSAVLSPIVCILALGSSLMLVILCILKKEIKTKALFILCSCGLISLLIIPAVWSYTPIAFGTNTMLPVAGPDTRQGMGGRFGNSGSMQPDSSQNELITYLQQNYAGEKYFLAVPDANTAAPIIIETGKAVMAMGGFSGNDPAMTLERFKEIVQNGELRFFMSGGRMGQNNDIMNWVEQNGKAVNTGTNNFDGGTLYDLKQ